MKILQINKFFYLKGGSERYFFDLSRLLEEKGHEVVHFSMEDERNLPSKYSSYFVKNINLEKPSFAQIGKIPRIIYSKEAQIKLENLIADTRPEIAHLHLIDRHLTPSIISVLERYKVPMVMTLHDYKIVCPNSTLFSHGKICERCKRGKFYQTFLQRCIKDSLAVSLVGCLEAYLHHFLKLYHKVNLFLAPSRFIKEKFEEFGVGEGRIVHLPLFLNFKQFEPNFGFEKPNYYFLYFGRLSKEKGLETILRTAGEFPRIRFVIAGEGLEERKLKFFVGENRLSNVEFVGYKERENLWKLVKNAIAILLPSRWYENQPYSVLESMALGKVVIGSRIGGILELIDDSKTGFLFEVENSDGLIAKIKYLLEHQNEIPKMGEKARKKIEKEHNQKIHYQKLIEIYRSLI